MPEREPAELVELESLVARLDSLLEARVVCRVEVGPRRLPHPYSLQRWLKSRPSRLPVRVPRRLC